MKIKDIFDKDIDRRIPPTVVVNEQSKEIIKTEIEEYVFTTDLIENLYNLLNDLLFQKNRKTGIWINGYYGSGKSHFIKYVHYCLDPETMDDAFDHFIESAKENTDTFLEATPSKILNLKNKIISSKVENIMFNIDSVSGQREDQDKITLIMLNQFNQFRGYNSKNIPLALLVEKHMDKLGKFKEFKKKINEIENYDWEKDAATLASLKLDTVLDVLVSLDNTIDRDSLRQKLKTPDDISIEDDLIPEFLDYLNDKPDDYRLLFLVDEISQYIGTNTNLLLNLQSIIEEIGAKCKSRIWFASTAQQTLDQVVGNTNTRGEDFGKILGRFETRISLESQKADHITKIRVLGKGSDGLEALKTFYDNNKDAIENQFQFSHDLYHGYENIKEFNLSYPFIPYQFRLISDVFESFSNLNYVVKEVRDNERSVLGITHYTVKKFSDKDVGYFIPFDAFFNEQFKQNLTHTARNIIERAISIKFENEKTFALRVISVLFMISNLTSTKKSLFPVNLENLTILLMDEPDTNRLELQRKIQSILDELTNQSIIREEDGQYHFLKEDEIDVSAEIQNTVISSDNRLTSLYEDIFSNMIKIQKKFTYGNNNFSLEISFEDKNIFNVGDINIKFSFYSNEDINQIAFGSNRNDLVICITDISKNDTLQKEFNRYVQTKSYIKKNYDSATGARRTTLDNFATRNKGKLSEIRSKFEDLFKSASIISGQQVIKPENFTNSVPSARYQEILLHHFDNVYTKHEMVQRYATSNDELYKSAKNEQLSTDKTLTPAEEAVHNWVLNRTDSVMLDEVIKHFIKPPYGWKDLSTIDVLIHLAQNGKHRFEWRNERIDLSFFYEKSIKRNERVAIEVKSVEEIDYKMIQQAVSDYHSIFNKSLDENEDPNRVHQEIVKKLLANEEQYKPFAEEYSRLPFGKHFQEFISLLREMSNIREPERLFNKLNENSEELHSLSDNCKELKEFVDSHYSNYKVIRGFTYENEQNFHNLDKAAQIKATILREYFNNDDLPSGNFPQIKKTHKELESEIKKSKANLVKQVEEEYKKVYSELEKAAKETGIKEPYPFQNQDEKLNEIKKEQSISGLQLLLSESSSFRSKCLAGLIDVSGKDSITFKISQIGLPSHLENEEQLEEYLKKLKGKLQKALKAGKTIIIE